MPVADELVQHASVRRTTETLGKPGIHEHPTRTRRPFGFSASWAARIAAGDGEGITALSVPVTTLASYVVVAAAVGVLAAVGPARRASKVNLLEAITTE